MIVSHKDGRSLARLGRDVFLCIRSVDPAELLALGDAFGSALDDDGIRAVAVDPFAAQLVAINVPQASALTFALGGALVAAAGVLVSTFLTFSASSGVVFTMKALIVVVMGGVGNMLGCLVAGLALGLSEALVASYVDPGLTLAVNFALFLIVLLVKPAGLFGRATR